jgi:hypothetical protein
MMHENTIPTLHLEYLLMLVCTALNDKVFLATDKRALQQG